MGCKLSNSYDETVAGRVPNRGFCYTLKHLCKRYTCLLPLLFLSIVTLLYLVSQSFPSFINNPQYESLKSMAFKAHDEEEHGRHYYRRLSSANPVVSIAGYTLVDDNNWLDPHVLGLRALHRPATGFGSSTWTPNLWNSSFFYKNTDDQLRSKHALPTSSWWLPWVLPPGTGLGFAINQHPYIISVTSKSQPAPSVTSTSQDRAGLEIIAPYPVYSRDGSSNKILGIHQSKGTPQSGLFLGAKLNDLGDFVTKHTIEDYGPLFVVKRWDISTFARDNKGIPLVENTKINSVLRARIIRGSGFISMEIPAGVTLKIASLTQNVDTRLKNHFIHIESFDASFTDRAESCATLTGKTITTDSFEIELSDHTQWIIIFDKKISITCQSTNNEDVIESIASLTTPILVRLALSDISQHHGISSGELVGFQGLVPNDAARLRSQMRWKLIGHIRKTSNSVAKFVSTMNYHNNASKALIDVFVNFPLRHQLEHLSKRMGFKLEVISWDERDIIQHLAPLSPEEGGPTLIVFPDGFADSAESVYASDNLRFQLATNAVAMHNTSVLGIGGTRSGTVGNLFRQLFSINLVSKGLMNPEVDLPPQKISEILKSIPTNDDENDPFLQDVLPEAMPTSLPFPSHKQTSIEMILPGVNEWPLNLYCRPSHFGSASQPTETCDGTIMGMWFYGHNVIQWLGMNWSGGDELESSGWLRLLERAIASSGCTDNRRTEEGNCIRPKRVLLVWDAESKRQKRMVDELITIIVDKKQITLKTNKDDNEETTTTYINVISLDKTLQFLKGTKEIFTGNIDKNVTYVMDKDSDTLRDTILRHALMEPIESRVDVAASNYQGFLRYGVETIGLRQFTTHSLYPPSGKTTGQHLWNPYRVLFFITPLHRKLEYVDSSGYLYTPDPLTITTLEDDVTTCLPSVIGPLCARSFGSSPPCRNKAIFPLDNIYYENDTRPLCDILSNGEIDPESWSISAEHSKIDSGKSVIMTHQKGGLPMKLTINMASISWDVFVRGDTGTYSSIIDEMNEEWKAAIKWAVTEDVNGIWKLDDQTWLKSNSADDVTLWARMIHRYAQIVLAASLVGLRKEKIRALGWLKDALIKFFSNQFDHTVMVYDASWGGIVPCGCDRDQGKGFCVPAARFGYSNQTSYGQSINSWMAVACPSLVDSSNNAGAGMFRNHHVLWGYVVYSTAIATMFDPSFPNYRVRFETPYGARRPKIHNLVIALIQDYANPFGHILNTNINGKEASDIEKTLTQFFPIARHKDWWRLHSYGSGIEASPDNLGMYQTSLSEAAFGYWAASLYTELVGDVSLTRWTRLLTSLEILSGNMYWHVKEYSTWAPPPLRYLGSLGKVGELGVLRATQYSSEDSDVFHDQIVPLTFLSFDLLEPGWALWIYERWRASCSQNTAQCKKSGADLGFTLLEMFATDWIIKTGKSRTSAEGGVRDDLKASNVIRQAIKAISDSSCLQMGSYDCGLHTLTNSILWTAMSSTWGGAPEALRREDGNGRFQIY